VEFLGIGYQELLLVLVLLLVVVGPDRLPGMAYQIGRAVRQMQGYARAVRDEFRDEIDYLDEQYKTIKGQVEDTQKTLRDEQAKLNTGLREVSTSVDATVALAAEPLSTLSQTPLVPGESTAAPATPPAETKPPMVF